MAAESAIEFDSINKTFVVDKITTHALQNISFKVKQGKITGLIGPDGAGKTTLMRLAVGLLLPGSGTIKLQDIDVIKFPLQELMLLNSLYRFSRW